MSAWADGEHHPPFAQTNGAGIEKNVADEICPRCGRRLLSNASIKRGLPARLGRAKNPLDHRSVSSGEPERSVTIARIAGETLLACAAFDGPLRLDLEPIAVYRVAERMLTRRLQRLIGKPGQSSGSAQTSR
jgi:hypothetical protein